MNQGQTRSPFIRCEDEPIHIPESVQGFGYLFAIEADSGLVQIYSENVPDLFDDWKGKIQKSFYEWLELDVLSEKMIHETFEAARDAKSRLPLEIKFKSEVLKDQKFSDYYAVIYESHGLLVIEIEPAVNFSAKVASRRQARIYSLNTAPRYKLLSSVEEMASAIAQMVRGFTGFERVLIYRFNEDKSGKVIAESKVDDIESYLNLYYPESDIPAQARELYKKSWLRVTSDAYSAPVRLLPSVEESGRKPLDMTQSILRSMSPVHLEYLRNQGLRSSMSVSLYSQEELWGLVICQHREVYYLPQEMRLEIEGLAHLFSWQLYAKEEEIQWKKRQSADDTINEMISMISEDKDIASIFEENSGKILQLMNASGFIFSYGKMSIEIGDIPDGETCQKLLEYVKSSHSTETVEFKDFHQNLKESRASDIMSALMVPLLSEKQFYTVWFRKEHIRELKWAGDPAEKSVHADKSERIKPRKSFVIHKQIIRNEAEPWSNEDRRIAELFNKVFLQHALRSQVLLQSNLDLLTAQDKSRNEFLATLAHELRNPLAPISSAVELLRTIEDRSIQLEAADIIERQIKQLVTIVNDLMDVSRITRGRVVLKKEKVDLNGVIRNSAEAVRHLMSAKDHDMSMKLSAQDILVFADVTRLTQIVSNILNNAAKYTPPHGKIRIETSVQDRFGVVTIEDDGVGISNKYLPRIFDMFSQADPFSAKSSGGLGIGLTLCKKLVDLHQGSIEAASAGPHKGSRFTVRIPLFQNEQLVKSSAFGNQAASRDELRVRVLVVDDNMDAARMLEMILKAKGAEVRRASTGMEGFAIYNEFRPDIALLDIGLPDMDGYELCRAIRATSSGRSAIIIAQTGWGQDEHIKKSKDAGFDRHLVKPVSPSTLLKLLTELVGKEG